MKNRLLQFIGSCLLAFICLVNLGNYENMGEGYTKAPGEDGCDFCHTPQVIGLTGGVIVEGLPNLVFPNQTYNLAAKVYDSNGNVQPENGGFMLTALNSNNLKFGSLSNASAFTKLFNNAGREYATHKTAQTFLGALNIDTVSYGFDWKAPGTGQTQTITFYYTAVLGNNSGTPNAINDRVFTKTQTITFVAPLLAGNITVQSQINCFGQNSGALSANPTGGLAPFSYNWSNGNQSKTAINLVAGTYTVTITDAAGQTGTASASLSQPTALNLVIANVQHLSCFGASNGQASGQASGATPPYSYLWSNGQTNYSISNVAAGTYTVTATDAKACTKTQSVTITQPTQLSLQVANIIDDNNGQGNGAIEINVNGGTGPYLFQWTGPNGFSSFNEDLTGLFAGVYQVTVTDQNSCTTFVPNGITINLLSETENLVQKNMRIFPNPASQTIQIELAQVQEPWQVAVFDLLGKEQVSTKCQISGAIHKLDVTGLPEGTYLLRLTSLGGQIGTRLFQIQKE